MMIVMMMPKTTDGAIKGVNRLKELFVASVLTCVTRQYFKLEIEYVTQRINCVKREESENV